MAQRVILKIKIPTPSAYWEGGGGLSDTEMTSPVVFSLAFVTLLFALLGSVRCGPSTLLAHLFYLLSLVLLGLRVYCLFIYLLITWGFKNLLTNSNSHKYVFLHGQYSNSSFVTSGSVGMCWFTAVTIRCAMLASSFDSVLFFIKWKMKPRHEVFEGTKMSAQNKCPAWICWKTSYIQRRNRRKYSLSLRRKPSASQFKPRVEAELYQQRFEGFSLTVKNVM